MNASSSGGVLDWIGHNMLANSIATILLLPFVLLLCRVFERRPAVQHLLWLLLLVKFMTPQLPGLVWVIPESIAGNQWQQATSLRQDNFEFVEETDLPWIKNDVAILDTVPVEHLLSDEKQTNESAASPPQKLGAAQFHLVAMTLLSAWILGAGYILVSIVVGLRKQRRIVKRSTSPGRQLSNIVNEVAHGIGLRKLASLVSPDIRSPFISCLGYVRLVWPQSLAASEPSSLRSLIAHEAAHVRRLDHYVAWLELVATIVWWWNPVFWFVRQRLRVSAEMACDAIALAAFPDDRCLYAEKLLELSASFKTGAPPLVLAVGGGTPSSIERRITMIVSDRVSCKVSLAGLLVIGVMSMSVLPGWTLAQNAVSPPSPEPVSWLLDPFLRRVPPATPTTFQQPATVSPPVALNDQEKSLLRLKAMYLVALSENRTTDAAALAAAITAIAQANATGSNKGSGALPGTAGGGPVDATGGGGGRGITSAGGGGDAGGPLGAVPGGVSAGSRDEIGGMPGAALRDSVDPSSIAYRHANGNFDVPNFIYPRGVIRDHLAVRIKVIGNNHGIVWGSNPYTDDSSLNAAAIHAGLVKAGETADVVFIRRPGKESYLGNESHGVTTQGYGPWAGSFELAPVSQYSDAPYLCDRRALRGNTDAYLSLNMLSGQAPLKPGVSLIVPLHGKAGAPIVGTDDYASDCNLDAAAVHAGVLKSGESAYVKLILAEGLESYAGSKRNGVESIPYGRTKMSLRFETVPSVGTGDRQRSTLWRGEATGRPGESNGSTRVLPSDFPPVAGPSSAGATEVFPDPIGGLPELASPSAEIAKEVNVDERVNRIRDLGPRRNWAFERFNLHRSYSLGQFRPHNGLAVRIRVTGEKDGLVWGSNPYSDDSSLHSASLHSGIVKEGETTDVIAIIRPGQQSYAGSESHGIKALDFGPYPGSFELVPVAQQPRAPYLCDRNVLRNSSDKFLSLNKLAGQAQLKPGVSLIVPLHGAAGAPIVGTDQYASDCNLDAAVVHAGVLKLGESGYVKIILAEGLDNYAGSKRNGVESYSYGRTKMSLRFEKLTAEQTNAQPATSSTDRTLRSLELITDGLGTAFVDADLLRAIEATSETKTSDPTTDSPLIPYEPSTFEQPVLPLPGRGNLPNGHAALNDPARNQNPPQNSVAQAPTGQRRYLRLKISSNRERQISRIEIGSHSWNATDDPKKDLARLKRLLSDSLTDGAYDSIEVHLEENLFYDRGREILDVCTRMQTADGQPINTVIVSDHSDSDDHHAPTIEANDATRLQAPEIMLQKGQSDAGSAEPVQTGIEDGK